MFFQTLLIINSATINKESYKCIVELRLTIDHCSCRPRKELRTIDSHCCKLLDTICRPIRGDNCREKRRQFAILMNDNWLCVEMRRKLNKKCPHFKLANQKKQKLTHE